MTGKMLLSLVCIHLPLEIRCFPDSRMERAWEEVNFGPVPPPSGTIRDAHMLEDLKRSIKQMSFVFMAQEWSAMRGGGLDI